MPPPPAARDWRSDLAFTRHLGDCWLAASASALARVPSILLPHTFNLLLNPLHPDAALLELAEATPALFDVRLFRSLGPG